TTARPASGDPGERTYVGVARALHANLRQVFLGSQQAVTVAVVAALSGGHLLIEDVPGVGKTVLASSLAASLGTGLSRVQGHSDLLPTDVTGVSTYSQDTSTWEFRPGPVFAHVLLVDELNRTPPRTQSALLEAMEEAQVTVDGRSWALPRPHLVIATQNPVGQLGTYPLVESQLDRFALATSLGYPDVDAETRLALRHGGREALGALRPVCSTAEWLQLVATTRKVRVSPEIAGYAVALGRATREASPVRLGASPRASITLVRSAQAHALLYGRDFVAPGDVQAMAVPALAHRLVAEGEPGAGVAIVGELLRTTAAPRP
ncbi:MAG TPA: MoxR family ATPase, partial [Acidimicrobiales bacterium]|nr:MoxR family ATPase [Acidimicrobiales bacterium]